MAGWIVAYEEALHAWESTSQPSSVLLVEVLGWLMDVTESGPPADHLPVPLEEDLYVSRIPGTSVIVTYLALAYEKRVMVRRID